MSEITVSDLLHLSIEERIQLVEDLWDSIAADAEATPSRIPLSIAQQREIARRSAAYRANPKRAVPIDEALERIERDLG